MVDGEERVIPAKIEENIGFIKEIKVPETADLRIDNTNGDIVAEIGGSKMIITFKDMTEEALPAEFYSKQFEISASDAEEFEISGYDGVNELFDKALVGDFLGDKTIYMTTELEKSGNKKLMLVTFIVPTLDERNIKTLMEVFSTIEFQ